MNILFSEHEEFYRELGLVDKPDVTCIFDGSKFYGKDEAFFKAFDIFVCAFYTMPHNVLLTLKFQSLGKATVICSDGIFDFANSFVNPMVTKFGVAIYHPIIQDYFLCVGFKEAEYFNNQVTTYNYLPKRVLAKNQMQPLPTGNKILITTANTAYFNDAEFKLLAPLIVGVIEVLHSANIACSLRIFDQNLLTYISDNVDIKLFNDVSSGFEETLQEYSGIITTPSSIAVTAMYHQRPVGLLMYRDTPMLLQSGWLIPSKEVFEQNLNSFMSKDQQRMNIQTDILKTYLEQESLTDLLAEISLKHVISQKSSAEYINKSLLNMLNSSFNFNIEWLVRRFYLKFKNSSIAKKLRLIMK